MATTHGIQYSVEIHNAIGQINGRTCAVGTRYLVRIKVGATLRKDIKTREEADTIRDAFEREQGR